MARRRWAPTAQSAYTRKVFDALVDSMREAQKKLQSARVGAGEGMANVNVNRRALMGDGTWWLGINPDGASDKTVGVVAEVPGPCASYFDGVLAVGHLLGEESSRPGRSFRRGVDDDWTAVQEGSAPAARDDGHALKRIERLSA